MARPSRFKTVKPTLEKIEDFNKQKTFSFSSKLGWLNNNSITICKSGDFFSFNLEESIHQRIELTAKDLDNAFSKNPLTLNGKTFSCLPLSLQTINNYILAKGPVSGSLNSLLEGEQREFSNTYLRFIQPIKNGFSKVGNFTEATDLNTDQEVMYGVGVLNFEIEDLNFDLIRIRNRKNDKKKEQEYLFIDSCQQIELEKFQNITTAFFQAYSFIFGILCGGSSYIVSSFSSEFEQIGNILFKNKPAEDVHKNYLFDSMEIRKYKFSKSYFLFPKKALSEMCYKLLTEEKYKRTLRILHEANMNKYSLSTSILYASALETISSIVPIKKEAYDSINTNRFKNSEILNELTEAISDNKKLNNSDKEFLISKKINSINTPTNANKLEAPFSHYNIELPKKFKEALRYRNKYLHGSIPKGGKLGSFQDDDNNRAFELQFLVNILALKYIGYNGYLKNRSLEMEYNSQKNQGKKEEEIELDHSLYYKI